MQAFPPSPPRSRRELGFTVRYRLLLRFALVYKRKPLRSLAAESVWLHYDCTSLHEASCNNTCPIEVTTDEPFILREPTSNNSQSSTATMNSHPAYREAGSTRMLHDRDADFAQLDTGVPHHFKMDEEAAAAAAAIASVNASQYANYAEQVSPMQESSSQNDGETNGKIKRARSMQKITRNRKITSCLQCRERKQKVGRRIQRARSAWLTPRNILQCDRQKPLCGNCTTSSTRGGMCTYVDTVEEAQEVLATEGEKDAK